MDRIRAYVVLSVSLLTVLAAAVSYAAPLGARCKKKCCLMAMVVSDLDTITMDLAGCGFGTFPPGAPSNPDLLSSTDLQWGFNQLYGRDPVFGLVSAITRTPESTSHLEAVDGQPPLFPANASHDLYLQVRIDGLDLEMFSPWPGNPHNLVPEPLRLVSDAPVFDLSADPSTYTPAILPVNLYNAAQPTQVAATLVGSAVEVTGFEGFRIDLDDHQVDGLEATLNYTIHNLTGEDHEVVYYWCLTGDLQLIEPQGDPRLLGCAFNAISGSDPIPLTIRVSCPEPFDTLDSVFVTVNAIDGSKKGAESVVDLAPLGTHGGVDLPAMSGAGTVVLAFAVMGVAVFVESLRRRRAA